jgi:hypothetical protein
MRHAHKCVTRINSSHASIPYAHKCVMCTTASHTPMRHTHQCVTHTTASHTPMRHTHQCVTHTNASHTPMRHTHQCVTHTNASRALTKCVTSWKVESDVDESEDDEGEGHDDRGDDAHHEPAVVALADALTTICVRLISSYSERGVTAMYVMKRELLWYFVKQHETRYRYFLVSIKIEHWRLTLQIFWWRWNVCSKYIKANTIKI